MNLSDELLDHAQRLADLAPEVQTEADRRRAISAAYYALFHQLIADATELFAGASTTDTLQQNLASQIGRMISHSEVRNNADTFINSKGKYNLKKFVLELLNETSPTVPSALDSVATTFGKLQDDREKADYVPSATHDSTDAIASVEAAARAVEDWKTVRSQPIARAFLASLLLEKKGRR